MLSYCQCTISRVMHWLAAEILHHFGLAQTYFQYYGVLIISEHKQSLSSKTLLQHKLCRAVVPHPSPLARWASATSRNVTLHSKGCASDVARVTAGKEGGGTCRAGGTCRGGSSGEPGSHGSSGEGVCSNCGESEDCRT